jgi:hypothetical protein
LRVRRGIGVSTFADAAGVDLRFGIFHLSVKLDGLGFGIAHLHAQPTASGRYR